MLICPTVFLKMKEECTLVQRMCKQMVTSAMPPSHHLKSKNRKNSINFFSKSQLQYKLCALFNSYYYFTLPIYSQADVTIRKSVICDCCGVASPEIGGGKMFDFWRKTLFHLEKRLSKHTMTIFTKKLWGGMAPLPPWLHLCVIVML